ncbi:MAG TPA: hypothetical protein VFO27_16355 [Bryobacteraceae bacterium]|nr:hypothetical protein [Bryobacteraceae bacterium]
MPYCETEQHMTAVCKCLAKGCDRHESANIDPSKPFYAQVRGLIESMVPHAEGPEHLKLQLKVEGLPAYILHVNPKTTWKAGGA